MTRRGRYSLLLLVGIVITVGSILVIAKFFSKATPIIHLDMRMDRAQAYEKARAYAQQLNLGPAPFDQAVQFITDDLVKTYVELEAGGVPALTQMMANNLYVPYVWQVRHFKEFDPQELILRFLPDGTRYGFMQTLGETAPGKSLTTSEAQAVAEKTARDDWHINFDEYQFIETAKELRISGRTDHHFIYERNNSSIGQGSYRLRLGVSGDKLTELSHFVKVPEEFLLRYKELRSAHEGIASAAFMLITLLYLIGGCVIGLALLAYQRYIIWKIPLVCAFILALLSTLNNLNQLPLIWMQYDTALSAQGFLLNYLVMLLYGLISNIFYFAALFITAESLTRKALGNQLQFWHIWNKRVASSATVLAYTLGGYVYALFDIAFAVVFYMLAVGCFGWWVPSDTLIEPNILASYFPWFTPIISSLKAGFTEECMARAIPLAGAILLGRRFGKPLIWVISALFLQAIIFGAAHASYAAQPAYARVVEIFIPALIFGILYLLFGLLPTIIAHVTLDIFWTSLPIFVSTAPNAFMHQFFVMLCTLLPLIIVLIARLRVGSWQQIPERYYNRAWLPAPAQPERPVAVQQPDEKKISRKTSWFLILSGTAAVVLWAITTQLRQDGRSLTITRAQAINIAQQALPEYGFTPDSSWTVLTTLYPHFSEAIEDQFQHTFIWREHTPVWYKKLLDQHYLMPAGWIVRFVKFHGTVSERSEEFQLLITRNGAIVKIAHKLPEIIAGASIKEEASRSITHTIAEQFLQLHPADLQEISAIEQKQPARKDWAFTFSSNKLMPLTSGDARVTITLAGDKFSSYNRFIFVPDEWKRKERNRLNINAIVSMICTLAMYAFFMLIFIISFLSIRRISWRLLLQLWFCYAFLFTISVINSYPELIAAFNTSEPFTHQLFVTFGNLGLQLLIKISLYAILTTLVLSYTSPWYIRSGSSRAIIGITMGSTLAALRSLLLLMQPSLQPLWADMTPLATYAPIIGVATAYLGKFIAITLLFCLLAIALNYLVTFKQRGFFTCAACVVTAELLLGAYGGITSIWFWLVAHSIIGIALACAYYYIMRYDYATIPIASATFIGYILVQQLIFYGFPAIIPGGVLAVVLIALITYAWIKLLPKVHNSN